MLGSRWITGECQAGVTGEWDKRLEETDIKATISLVWMLEAPEICELAAGSTRQSWPAAGGIMEPGSQLRDLTVCVQEPAGDERFRDQLRCRPACLRIVAGGIHIV